MLFWFCINSAILDKNEFKNKFIIIITPNELYLYLHFVEIILHKQINLLFLIWQNWQSDKYLSLKLTCLLSEFLTQHFRKYMSTMSMTYAILFNCDIISCDIIPGDIMLVILCWWYFAGDISSGHQNSNSLTK